MATQQRKESDQLTCPCQLAELTAAPAASQICKHHLPVAGNSPEGVDGWACCGRHHLDHSCKLPPLKESGLDSTKGSFGDLSLQSCEGSAETLPKGPGCSYQVLGQLPGEDISEGSTGFHCPAALGSAGHWRGHTTLHFYRNFPKWLP